jgi:hypothetical protein
MASSVEISPNKFLDTYKNCAAECEQKFQYNLTFEKRKDELTDLINVNRDGTVFRSYKTNTYNCAKYGPDEEMLHNYPDVYRTMLRVINETITEICKKETYVNAVMSYTNEEKEKDEMKDVVIELNRYIRNRIPADLRGLVYSQSESGNTGFVKEIIKLNSPMRATPTIYIDKKWCTDVYDRKMSITEYQGKRAFTLSMDLVSDDNDKTIFKSKILQITGTREEIMKANYQGHCDWKAVEPLFKVHDLFMSVSKDRSGSSGYHRITALAKTAKQAESVMKRRQKLEMMRTLNI